MNNLKVLTNGIFKENPTFALLLGMCPTLGVTTSAINGMGMGLATAFVLVMSNLVISALRKVIPDDVRLPAAEADKAHPGHVRRTEPGTR